MTAENDQAMTNEAAIEFAEVWLKANPRANGAQVLRQLRRQGYGRSGPSFYQTIWPRVRPAAESNGNGAHAPAPPPNAASDPVQPVATPPAPRTRESGGPGSIRLESAHGVFDARWTEQGWVVELKLSRLSRSTAVNLQGQAFALLFPGE